MNMIKIDLLNFMFFNLNSLFNGLKMIIFILVTCYNQIFWFNFEYIHKCSFKVWITWVVGETSLTFVEHMWRFVTHLYDSITYALLCIIFVHFNVHQFSPLKVDACSRCHKPLLKFMLSIFLKKWYILLWWINTCSKMYSIAIIEFKVQSTRFAKVIKYICLSLLKTKLDLSKLDAYLYYHLSKKT
jgi:hypothetical protein